MRNGATTFKPARAVIAWMAAAMAVSACGDGGGNAKTTEAAAMVRDYYYTAWQAPSPDWEVRKVRAAKKETVTVEATIVTASLATAIMERSRMEQMKIARMACPATDAQVWTDIGKSQAVGVSLSGKAGHIINALCKRP